MSTNGSQSTAPAPSITTDGGVTTIVRYATANPDVARLLDQADDRETCLERMLSIGAGAMLSAGLQLDTSVVERRFDDLTARLDTSIKSAFGSIEGLLDGDGGTIACALDGVKEEIAAVITTTFDPTKTTSVVNRMNELFDGTQAKLVKELHRELSPDVDGSMLNRTVRDINGCLQSSIEGVLVQVRDIQDKLEHAKGGAAEAQKGTQKGVAFEDVLQPLIGRLASLQGDMSERNSTEKGVKAGKVGDFTITLNQTRNGGATTRFVIEAKDRDSMSKKVVVEELRAAMGNRDAKAGVLVFAHQHQTPDRLPFQTMGDMAIVACEDGDTTALELAYQWARWVACRELDSAGADWGRIQKAVAQAAGALDAHQTIKRNHSTARKAIEEAVRWTDHLVSEVRAAIDLLGQAVDEAQEAQAA
ncbi:MAG TPA: hypothetical protein VI854_08015 [Acidimicrobiia bacterium]|nr:hypothetical protein [Acidimicrobiia bacterium]